MNPLLSRGRVPHSYLLRAVLACVALLASLTVVSSPAAADLGDETPGERFVGCLFNDLVYYHHEGTEDQYAEQASTVAGRQMLVHELAYGRQYVHQLVARYYRDTLQREPDSPGAQYWSDLIIFKTLTTSQVAGHFYASAEYFTNAGGTVEAWVEDLYAKLLERPADGSGKAYWAGVVAAKGRPAVATAFYQSLESRRVRVSALYERLLQRDTDAAGRDYWADVLLRSGDDVALVVNLATSAEYFDRTQRVECKSTDENAATPPVFQ